MTKLSWGGRREYEAGVDRGVFYPQSGPGEAWRGLVSVVENPSDAVQKTVYVDGIAVVKTSLPGFFAGNIEVLSYPPSFYSNDVLKRRGKPFGLSYRTGTSENYNIHLVYNVILSPAALIYQHDTVDSYRWDFTTLPISLPESQRSAHLVIDSSVAYSWVVEAVENILYGTDESEPRLPTPQELYDLFEENSILVVTDHGDGSFTVTGPDSAIQMLDSTTFEITWPSAVYLDSETYQISSL